MSEKKAASRGNRPIAGFYEDDVPILVDRWRAFAQAYDGEPSKRFGRLADQMVSMVESGRCTFSGPIQAISLDQRTTILRSADTHHCYTCKRHLPREDFLPSKRKDGVMTRCKDCAQRSG